MSLPPEITDDTPLLEARGLGKVYPKSVRNKKPITILQDVSFTLRKNQTLGIIGESGCGKSTLAKIMLKIEPPTTGQLFLNGRGFGEIPKQEFRKQIQMIFQDCYSSLNPRHKASTIVADPLVSSGLPKKQCYEQAEQVLAQVGLGEVYGNRYPHMFSGGQQQRIGIARAIITKPQIVVCDEPVSALDISVQAQIINLLMELQKKYQLSYIIISHDLAVVNHIADTILVMYFGKTAEYGKTTEIFSNPRHPYTQALLASTTSISHIAQSDTPPPPPLSDEFPSPYDPPTGCVFHTRCPLAKKICKEQVPELREIAGSQVACHFAK